MNIQISNSPVASIAGSVSEEHIAKPDIARVGRDRSVTCLSAIGRENLALVGVYYFDLNPISP